MPTRAELPGVRGAVVPLVGAGDAVVTNWLPIAVHVLPPSSERWITCPNQLLDWDAYSRSGSAGDPLR
jgi:hypothetical protein